MTETESIVRKFYAALGRGNADAALVLLDPEVKWTEAKRTPYDHGELTGPHAVVNTVLGPIGRDFDDFAATPEDFIGEGDRVAAFGLYTGRFREGGKLLAPFVHLWTVRDRRIVRFVQYTDSAAWADAILGAAPAPITRPALS